MAIDGRNVQIPANHGAAADAMAFPLMRTAQSTFVKETEDFSCQIVTPEGLAFASPRSFGVPWNLGIDYGPVLALIDTYREGDICITNDSYAGTLRSARAIMPEGTVMNCVEPAAPRWARRLRRAFGLSQEHTDGNQRGRGPGAVPSLWGDGRYGHAGTFRGGLAMGMEFEISTHHTIVTARNRSRSDVASSGVLDARAGAAARFSTNPNTPGAVDHGKIKCNLSGATSAVQRDAARVLRDVACGFTCPNAARLWRHDPRGGGGYRTDRDPTRRHDHACGPFRPRRGPYRVRNGLDPRTL